MREQLLPSHREYYQDRVPGVNPLQSSVYSTLEGTIEVNSYQSVRADREHRYAVRVEAGLLHTLPRLLATRYPNTRMVVLTDSKVEHLYGRRFLEELCAHGVPAESIVLPEGEASKSYAHYLQIIEQLYTLQFDRRGILLALGGGLITDVGGFVAATYMRGISYINIPTTLLAQHDAAVGGKVAVNMPWAKNFVGAFHHPTAVYCDPDVLKTLTDRELSAGIAESIKVGLCGDASLLSLLTHEWHSIRHERCATVLGSIVSKSIAGKIRLLAPDPYEVDLRRALNLGHTFGHALEVQTHFDQLLHGEAVGFGLAVAAALSEARGLCSSYYAESIYQLLHLYGLPPRVIMSDLMGANNHLDAIRLVRGRKLNYVLLRHSGGSDQAGDVEIVSEVSSAEIIDALNTLKAHPLLEDCFLPG